MMWAQITPADIEPAQCTSFRARANPAAPQPATYAPIPGHNLPPPKKKSLHQRADRTPVHARTKVQDSIFALSSATLRGHSNPHPPHLALPPDAEEHPLPSA